MGNENFSAVADLNASGAVTARRFLGPDFDFLWARVDGAGKSWYLSDPLGSVRAVAYGTGAVTGTQAFKCLWVLANAGNDAPHLAK